MQVVELGISHGKESSLQCHANGAEGPARLTFYLDGAHTEESMATCATWFADIVKPLESQDSQSRQGAHSNTSSLEIQRVLLFNCMQVQYYLSWCLAVRWPVSRNKNSVACHAAIWNVPSCPASISARRMHNRGSLYSTI